MNQQGDGPKMLEKPVVWDDLYPGKFLKAADLKGKHVTVTISAVNLAELEGDTGKMAKGVISFQGKEKMMALNRTNGLCLRAMFGKKVQEWVGKRVTLLPTETKFGNEMVDAIRIFGSPDIGADMEIEIKLPKKRPVKMTLRRTGREGSQRSAGGASASTSPAATSTGTADAMANEVALTTARSQPDPATWSATLSGCTDLPQLERAWQDCCTAFNDRPPIEVDEAYQTRKEAIGEAAGRQLEL